MASSRKPDTFVEYVAARLAPYHLQGRRVTLALSGGVDSVVLLDILAQLRVSSPFHLAALYVNHGISPNAVAWGHFCAGLCEGLGVDFADIAVKLERGSGDSLEALAREARYRVFAGQPSDFMVLAHHLDDQAETVILQLLRGAGPKGLSAMPERRSAAVGAAFLRPLLGVARDDIVAYALARGLQWIEDESNQDTRFDRNYLRRDVLPLVARRFPSYRLALSRASRHAAEAAALLDEVAATDGALAISNDRLDAGVLRSLPTLRAKNLLRWFLDGQGVVMPSTVRLEEALRQLREARPDAQVGIRVGKHELRRYRDQLYVIEGSGQTPEFSVVWNGQDMLDLPVGTLRFEIRRGEGISRDKLRAGELVVCSRVGNDKLRPDCRRPRRSLKNLLQETGVPPWLRDGLPMLYCGRRLVWVADLGVDCSFQAEPDEDGLLAIFSRPL